MDRLYILGDWAVRIKLYYRSPCILITAELRCCLIYSNEYNYINTFFKSTYMYLDSFGKSWLAIAMLLNPAATNALRASSNFTEH